MAIMGVFLIHVPFLVFVLMMVRPERLASIILIVGGALVFLCIILRRHYPMVFFSVVVALLLVQAWFVKFPTISLIVLLLAIFDVARWMKPRTSHISLVVALLVMMAGPIRLILSSMSGPSLTVILLVAVSGVGAVTTAYTVARRSQDVSQARAQQLQAERDAARLQIAEQTARQHSLETQIRTNIARELHDIVAHSVAVMVVQAEGGLASQAPDKAEQALTNISDTGREALQEMRRIVRMLRADSDGAADMKSAPGIADIPALIDKAEAIQTVSGSPHGLTPIIEMTVYRVVQEALTNSIKHGVPGSKPRVSLNWEPDLLTVQIVNRLPKGRSGAPDALGVGLIGMAERVQTLDGVLTTGPNGKGGFEVCAQIPLQTDYLGQ